MKFFFVFFTCIPQVGRHVTEDVKRKGRHLDSMSAYKFENTHKRYKCTIYAGPKAEQQLLLVFKSFILRSLHRLCIIL